MSTSQVNCFFERFAAELTRADQVHAPPIVKVLSSALEVSLPAFLETVVEKLCG